VDAMNDLPPAVWDRDGDEWPLNGDDGTYGDGEFLRLSPEELEESWGPLKIITPFTFKGDKT